jgi:hypothetical protein
LDALALGELLKDFYGVHVGLVFLHPVGLGLGSRIPGFVTGPTEGIWRVHVYRSSDRFLR